MSNYVYLQVKLYLEEGRTEDSVQEIVQDLDYSFDHSQIIDYEIVDIFDMNLSSSEAEEYIDPYNLDYIRED